MTKSDTPSAGFDPARARSHDADALWAFALDYYGLPDIQQACLTMQDAYGVDVVLLLGLLWRAWRDKSAADTSQIDRLDAVLAPWRDEVVAPLRKVRRAMKPRLTELPSRAAELRARIKATELEAERVACDLLADALATLPLAGAGYTRRSAARESVDALLARYGVVPCPETLRLSTLLAERLDDLPQR